MGRSVRSNEWECNWPPNEVRTLVLVGPTGNGKSATGNSILQTKTFKSMSKSSGITTACQLQKTELEGGRRLNVIDTPGFFDSSAKPDFIGQEIIKCIRMAEDGVHAFLVVLSVRNRFLVEEENAFHNLKKIFGDKICDYIIVVFTNGDDLEANNQTLDEYLGGDFKDPLKEVLQMCGNRHVLFDNRTKDESKKHKQLNQLLCLVNEVVSVNVGQYTNDIFFQSKVSKLEETIQGLKEQLAELHSACGKSEEKIHELEMKIEELRCKGGNSEQKAELHATRMKLEGKVHELEKKIEELQNKVGNGFSFRFCSIM